MLRKICLTKIIFMIAGQGPLEEIEKLKKRWENKGGNEDISMEVYVGKAFLREKDENLINKETLFVADNGGIMRELKTRGAYVIAYLHKGNEEESFSEASYAITEIESLDYDFLIKVYRRESEQPWEIMETHRCVIRETIVEDVDDFYEIYAQSSITKYMESLLEEREEEREYTRNYIKNVYGFYGYGLWTVIHKESKNIIGRAGLSWREGFDIPELGFVIAVPYQRQGYAYEVCRAIMEYGKEELDFNTIQALVRRGNSASVRLCEKLGFIYYDAVEDKGSEYDLYLFSTV